MGWESDKRSADKFMPEIKRILGELLICDAPREEDLKHNTDLIVLHMDSVGRVAVRVRNNEYLHRYPNEFTIRSGRPSGNRTELSKIIEGWGDLMFYGFADDSNTKLAKWTIIRLGEFRLWINRYLLTHKRMPGKERRNGDASSNFMAFDIKELPSAAILHTWTEQPKYEESFLF